MPHFIKIGGTRTGRQYGEMFTSRTFYRQDCCVAANWRYGFYSQANNQVFRPAEATRCTDSGQTLTLQYGRVPMSAWLCKITRESVQTGGNATPKISKISTFW